MLLKLRLSWRWTRLLRLAGAAAAALLLVGIAESAGVVSLLQARLSEVRFHLHPRAPSGDIVLVDIDSQSLAQAGVWPWPRTMHAELVRAAAEAGAARIAFDVDFSSASRPEADAAFAAAIDETGLDTLLAAFQQVDVHGREQASLPLPNLMRSAWPAAVTVAPDTDGSVRSLSTGTMIGGAFVPSMAALIAGQDPSAPETFGIDFSIDATQIPRVSYVDLLAHRVDPRLLAGRTLLIGASAVELHDLFPAPIYGIVPGSTILALGGETLLQGRALRLVEVRWAVGAAGAILLLFMLRRCRVSRGMILLALCAFALELAAFLLQDLAKVSLGTAPLHALLLSLGFIRLVQELGIRRILAWVAKARADNSQILLERVVDGGFGGVVLIDEEMRIVRVNEEARRLLGVRLGASATDLPEPMAHVCRTSVPKPDAQPGQRVTGLMRRGGGLGAQVIEYALAPLRLTEIDDASVGLSREATHICLTVHDVTERQMVEDRMRYLALHDGLTNLANRTALAERLKPEALGGGIDPLSSHALIAFDLDRFKAVNDSLGHGIGDQVLVEVARRAKDCMPEGSAIARLGGDEFMIFLPGHAEDAVHELAARLKVEMQRPMLVSNHRLSVGVSLGLCCWTGTAPSDDLMRRADLALYRAKRTGQLQVFEPSMELDRLVRLELERELLLAVDTNALTVVFQPQVDLRSGDFTGAEALVRWQHPVKGFISPAVFIPIAEEMGLIHRVGERVLQLACQEAVAWAEPLRVAVNVSALQLSTGDVVAAVRGALAGSGLSAERLELEITESAFVNEDAHLKAVFENLLALGISFSLDDFGTGYSSLGYLHRFPISKLKIDRSFVTNLPSDGASLAILRSILALTQGLGLRSIAEGIETEEQAETLRILGCGEGQGYLYSKPIDPAAMRELLISECAFNPVAGVTA